MTTFYLYDRWGNQLRAIKGITSAKRTAVVNGEHRLVITTSESLDKGQRVVYKDPIRGMFREFIVQEPEEERGLDGQWTTATCEDSIAELNGDYLIEVEPTGTATRCLTSALQKSRWTVGSVDVLGSQRCSFYHISAREAVNKVADAFGGELSTSITVSGADVVERRVNLLSQIGSDTGSRFTFRKGLKDIKRTVEIDDVITKLYGYGKGVEKYDENGEATGGYTRKITFGDVNGGRDYVANEDALKIWGRPDGKGGITHVEGKVEFDDCEDPHELLRLTKAALEDLSEPKVSYEATVSNFKAAGYAADGVSEGDKVYIIDTTFEPELRLQGRVTKIEEDLLEPENTKITLGNILALITDTMEDTAQKVGNLTDHMGFWDGAASVSSNYINELIKRLNQQFDASGTYIHVSFEHGMIFASVPLDENGRPTRVPASAIQICSEGFRIASTNKANSEWNWRTFGTGDGFTADEINAGVIRGGSNYWNLEDGTLEFKQGMITSADGTTSWNITTGDITASNARMKGLVSAYGGLDPYIEANGERRPTNSTVLLSGNGISFFYGDHSLEELKGLANLPLTDSRVESMIFEDHGGWLNLVNKRNIILRAGSSEGSPGQQGVIDIHASEQIGLTTKEIYVHDTDAGYAKRAITGKYGDYWFINGLCVGYQIDLS